VLILCDGLGSVASAISGIVSTMGQALAWDGPLMTSKSVDCRDCVAGRFMVGLLDKEPLCNRWDSRD
jgi:hypothetical protein